MFLSRYLNLKNELDALGVFDCLLDEDSHFFVNVILLKETDIPEFKSSYNKILKFFANIMLLLENSKVLGDKFYKQAYKLFKFDEINEINLGFAIQNGASFGPNLRKQVLADAFDIVKVGSKSPEIFLLMELFEQKIGPDRISDMICSIIREDIINYTNRINSKLGINKENYPQRTFQDGFLYNEYRNRKVFYLPKVLLNKIPIAKEWSDIDDVINKNEFIRQQINTVIAENWYNISCFEKKAAIKNSIILLPDKCKKAVEEYNNTTVEMIRLEDDYRYGSTDTFQKKLLPVTDFLVDNFKDVNSFVIAQKIIGIFKQWVENNKGWSSILEFPSVCREKYVQRLMHLSALAFANANNIDLNFEPNEGNGPVDFKLSLGNNDKTIVELKLSSNGQYIHGYETQIVEYAKSEQTAQMIYVLVDTGNPIRVEKLKKIHNYKEENKIEHPELIVIDSKEKKSASIK